MSFDLSQYPETSKWIDEVSQTTTSLGAMVEFQNILKKCYRISLNRYFTIKYETEISLAKEVEKHKRNAGSMIILGYDHPILNKKWENRIVTDGQRIFFPQSLFLKNLIKTKKMKWFEDPADKNFEPFLINEDQWIHKSLDKIIKKYPNFDQTPEKTKQDLLDANLPRVVEKIFTSPSFPIDILKHSFESDTPILEDYKSTFIDFFKKLEPFKENLNKDEFEVFKNFIEDDFEEKWGKVFSVSNQIAPFVVFKEWMSHIGATHWGTAEFLNHPDQLRQTWGLLGVLNESLRQTCGMGWFLFGLNQKIENSNHQYNYGKTWWQETATQLDKYKKNPYLSVAFFDVMQRDEMINGVSMTDFIKNPDDFDDLIILSALKNPIKFANMNKLDSEKENIFSIILKNPNDHLKAYMDVLHQAGWVGQLDDYKKLEISQKEGRYFCSLWKDLLENDKMSLKEDNINPQLYLEKIYFLMEQGLSLNSKESREDFIRWFLDPDFELEKEEDFFKLSQVILDHQPNFSKALFDSFMIHAEINSQKYQGEFSINYAKRLNFLMENKWINWESFGLEEKHTYLNQLQASSDHSLKAASIALQRSLMNENIDSKPHFKIIPKVRL